MFFILSKILAFMITPVIWIFVLLLFAIFSKNKKIVKRCGIAALVCLYVFCNSFILDECVRLWENSSYPKNKKTQYEAGIVLGGMLSYDKTNDIIQFNRQIDRLLQAVKLYKAGTIKKIIFTGGSGSILVNEPEALHAGKFLVEIGIPEADVILEPNSKNTYENAVFTKNILNKNFKKTEYLLITSGLHMRRAYGCFKKAGIQVIPYTADRHSGPRKFVFDHMFIPEAGVLYTWNNLLHEIVGYITYKAIGYI